jgi:hypothetical protein
MVLTGSRKCIFPQLLSFGHVFCDCLEITYIYIYIYIKHKVKHFSAVSSQCSHMYLNPYINKFFIYKT